MKYKKNVDVGVEEVEENVGYDFRGFGLEDLGKI